MHFISKLFFNSMLRHKTYHKINIFESLAQIVYIFKRVVHKKYDETLIYITYSRIEKYIPFLYVFRLCLCIDWFYIYTKTLFPVFLRSVTKAIVSQSIARVVHKTQRTNAIAANDPKDCLLVSRRTRTLQTCKAFRKSQTHFLLFNY